MQVGATRSRLLIAAMAAGAVAAGGYATISQNDQTQARVLLVSGRTGPPSAAAAGDGPQVITVTPPLDPIVHREELARGVSFAQDRAQREARLRRPLFVTPTRGILTSGYGARWGTLHGGLDIANSIGTPITAAADGVVIAAGPTPGYGMWVKLRHNDGTVTLYGHIDTTTVTVGDRVTAGDQIATMGNRGNSTGPHLHFEVHAGGTERIDPAAWLAQRGADMTSISD